MAPDNERAPRARVSRRSRIPRAALVLLAAATIWASVASVAWVAASNRSAVQGWNADVGFLGRVSGEFGAASGELENALIWDNLTWGWEALSSIGSAARLAQDGGGAPDGVAIATELNLTARNFGCAAYGLTNALDWIQSGQTTWTAQASYLQNMSLVSSELATRLRAVQTSGTDPMIQFGPAVVAQIQGYAGMLYTLVTQDFQAPRC